MRTFLLVCLLLFLVPACLSPSGDLSPPAEHPGREHPWAPALRALDPADTTTPAHDITAVYLRQAGDVLQIRIDLLDFQNATDLSLSVEIGDGSGPGAAPLSVHIPSEEGPARVSLDPMLATVIIDVPLSELPSLPRVNVSTPEEAVTGLSLDGPVPAQTVPLLLAFYNTFAARFPAEAVRSWDGAHTGPRGDRHGLRHLLDAAEEYQTPIVLLDLKEPGSLSVLDAMGVLPQIRRMQAKDLLILPQTSSDEILFGLPLSLYWFEPSLAARSNAKYAFRFTTDTTHLHRWFELPAGMRTSIPTAMESEAAQPAPDGPSLEVRRALLETALDMDERDLLVLGGSLRESTWGSPDMAGATLAYFASRPYIEVLTADELMNFPAKWGKPQLHASPLDNPFSKLETHYKSLSQPVLDFVANWQGSRLSSCNTDIDKDGQPECVLANEAYLAILDPQGARLTYLFAVERDSISLYLQQLIGPSWQVAVGLSNPSLWDLSAGEAADPGAYPGAFADMDEPFRPYEPAIAGNTVVFTSPDGTRTKTFTLNETGLHVEYQTQEPVLTRIPLLVEPEMRFTPGWAKRFIQQETPERLAWGLVNGPMVTLQLEDAALSLPAPVERSGPGPKGAFTMQSFNESISLLANPEDPNLDYPPGHYIPFPMAVAELQLESGISTVQITVTP